MTQKPNDRYYTVAEVRQAKKFRADLRQFIKDSALDMVLRRETRAVIDSDGRLRHVPASGRTGMSRMWSDDTMAWMDDPNYGACLPVDPIRQAAYDEAMAKFSGRKSLRHYMTSKQIRDVQAYDGPVVLGDPVWERLHAQAKPYPKAASATKSITCTRDVSDPVAIEIRHLPIKRIKPSDYEGIIRNCDPEGNIDVCSDPKFRGNQ